jgi:hypothetical protein
MTTFDELAERLESMSDQVPDTVDILDLAAPSAEESERRTEGLLESFGDISGVHVGVRERMQSDSRTVLRLSGGGRAVTFRASGALIIKAEFEPFADLFDSDPGDKELTATLDGLQEKLGLASLVPAEDRLDFERLWRIMAAGGDPQGAFSDPVLCRAVGAYRHVVRDLPIYGRASATLEVTGAGRLASLSISTRRFADDGGGAVIAKVVSRRPGDAAHEIAQRLARALDEEETATLEPQFLRFGYLSLSRRRPQSLLAPVFVAAVTVAGSEEQERSAHLITVAGSDERFLRIPGAVPPGGNPRR